MAFFVTVNSFNAGELSPKMIGRSDVSQYTKGCRTLQNFMVTPYGSVERRPGTRFIARTKYDDKQVRLIRFVFSSTVAYVCEFGHEYIRFFAHGQAVTGADGNIIELASPYKENELPDIQFVQSADIMTITHPHHPVMELKRLAVDNFSLAPKEFTYPPMMEPNLDDEMTITPEFSSGGGAKGSSVILTASKELFTAGNAGGFFQLAHTRKANEISIDFKGDAVSSTIEVYGYWSFTTHGTWSGTIKIQRSFDNGTTWSDFRTYSSARDTNISTSGTEESEDAVYRLKMEDYAASSTGTLKLCRCLLVNPDYTVTGVVRIDAVESATRATGTVIRKIGEASATTEWNEGAFSDRRGYPVAVAFFEERLIFGGTASRPQTVWGSKTNSWDNFLVGTKDDDALEFTIASDTVNTINWMVQHDALIIGTMDSEWTLSAGDAGSALTPSNFMVRRQSAYGSAGIPASMVGETILFVQRGKLKVREFVFQWEKDGYSAPDMTILADHITAPGIRSAALQQLPDSIYWCILDDGSCAALTYERDQEVVGWQKHTTAGKFLSVAVIPDGDEDRIYFAVERNGKHMIELMNSRKQHAGYLDCAVTQNGSQITAVSQLDHLEGQAVAILADGAPQRVKNVANGTVSLDTPAEVTVTAGLDYYSILSPMPIEIETQNGSSVLRKKAIGEVRLRIYQTVGGQLRCGDDSWQQIPARSVTGDDMDRAITPKTEVVSINVLSGFQQSTSIEIRQNGGLPMNITAITVNYEVKN